MARVFLSYDRRDAAKAELVAKALGRAGHSVWWDQEIRGGRHFSKDIEQALADAEAVVVLWSRNSVESDWVRDEAAAGRDRGCLVPATLDGSAPPLGFRQLQTVDLSGGLGRGGSETLNALALAVDEMAAPGATASSPQPGQSHPNIISRRLVLLALGGSAAAVGGLGYWRFGRASPASDPKVAALLDQAWQSWSQGTSEGNSQALGLYRRATAEAPDDPDTWGFLGCAYGDRGHAWVTGAERDSCWQRAREAGRHALALDSKNAYGRAAVAYARPRRGNWTLMDREFRRAEADQPGKWLIVYSLALLMGEVGRFAEGARLFASLKGSAPTATQYGWQIEALWASGQLDEAERLLDEAMGIYGSSARIWWQRFDMLLNGGRATAAIALTEDREGRPANLDESEVGLAVAVARASLSRDPKEIAAVAAQLRKRAAGSADLAERAIAYAAILGQIGRAYEIAQALYFSRGFTIPDLPSLAGSSAPVTLDERRPRVLFLPPTKGLRAGARFGPLVKELGLTRYWRETASRPDYLQA